MILMVMVAAVVVVVYVYVRVCVRACVRASVCVCVPDLPPRIHDSSGFSAEGTLISVTTVSHEV